jgi:hypothetical protein
MRPKSCIKAIQLYFTSCDEPEGVGQSNDGYFSSDIARSIRCQRGHPGKRGKCELSSLS